MVVCFNRINILSYAQPNVQILLDGHRVSRIGDYIIYSVEAEAIDSTVALYGPCMPYQHRLRFYIERD